MVLLLVSLVVFLLLGIPVAYALGLSASVYFVVVRPELMGVLPQRFFEVKDIQLNAISAGLGLCVVRLVETAKRSAAQDDS